MKALQNNIRLCLTVALASAALIVAGCSGMGMKHGGSASQTLSGGNEVPPVSTTATGVSTVKIGADKSVSGSITTTGIVATMAHVHMAPTPNANGPVIVPMKKTADNVYSVPDNAVLTDEQYAAYKAGRLYVNVHSAAHPAGEIRANLEAK